ncbi:MAG: hypothetical protein Q8R92_21165 [Deltaproteobacteria bacterium]|nr:hypothetical protein [Deltaproteobacteria bacterium]
MSTRQMGQHADGYLQTQWTEGNDEGRGCAVGDENMTAEEAALWEGWEVLHAREASNDICIARKPDGGLVGIGDANGPWAVDLVAV